MTCWLRGRRSWSWAGGRSTLKETAKKIAVTRPVGKGSETVEFIRELGWDPLIVHTVQLRPRDQSELFSELRDILATGSLDWLVFMSVEGVQALFQVFRAYGNLLPSITGSCRFLAVGPKTREALREQGVGEVAVPESYSSEGVAAFLAASTRRRGSVLLARSAEADDSLGGSLASKGFKAVTIHAYSSSLPAERASVREFVACLKRRQVGGVLFTSSKSASSLFEMVEGDIGRDELVGLLRDAKVGAIGPATAGKLRELGLEPNVQPTHYLINEGVKLLVDSLGDERRTIQAFAGNQLIQ